MPHGTRLGAVWTIHVPLVTCFIASHCLICYVTFGLYLVTPPFFPFPLLTVFPHPVLPSMIHTKQAAPLHDGDPMADHPLVHTPKSKIPHVRFPLRLP